MNRVREKIRVAAATRLPNWGELNRQWLLDAMERLAARIDAQGPGAVAGCIMGGAVSGFTPALVQTARIFGLSPFERELLLLVAGLELDPRLRAAITARHPGGLPLASFGLALGLLVEPHWDALSPDAPLRHWHMVGPEPDLPLTAAPLRIDERILHHLAGVSADDARLAGIARRLSAPAQREGAASEAARRVARALAAPKGSARVVAVCGAEEDPAARQELAIAVAAELGTPILWVAAQNLPADPVSLETAARHLDREAALTDVLAVVSVESVEGEPAASSLAARLGRPFLWLGKSGPSPAALPPGRGVLRFEALSPTPADRRRSLTARWRQLTDAGEGVDAAILAALDRTGAQFRLSTAALESMAERVSAVPAGERAAAVWSAGREAARGGLDAIAQRVESRVTFDDLVLPSGQMAALQDIARHLRHREQVFGAWNFGAKHQLGQGLVALFAGESGTGKTLAAEAIANALELDLYRADLATLVSKYIGETEKNLKRLFEAAEASGAVLLFDEADALFGKRSEVKDSHDRYANIEIAYLLQLVEAYRGLAILTTNMRSALDCAFLRRIRFIVSFPFPDAVAREQIWRRQFPPGAPLSEIDFVALGRLNLAGGNIRTIALGAAFKAADRRAAIGQPLILEAAREEFAKLDRAAGPLETGASA